jgi:hypothetical protein
MHRTIPAFLLLATMASAQAAPRLTQEPSQMHAGQKVLVDDGTCPAGQIKEVIGVATRDKNNTRIIIARSRNCVPRGR